MNISHAKKILSRIFLPIIALVILYPFILTIIQSTHEFRISQGLFDQESIGWDNFTRFFSLDSSYTYIVNTIITSLFALFIGSGYVYVSALSIGSTNNYKLKAGLFILFCIPSLIPTEMYSTAFKEWAQSYLESAGSNIMAEPSVLLNMYTGLIDAFRLSGFVLIAAFFIKQDTAKEALKVMLLFVAIKLITFFTVDLQASLSMMNSANMEATQNLSTYAYQVGLLYGDYSFSSAVTVIRAMFQFVPAIIACVIMIFTFKSKPKKLEPYTGFVGFSAFGVLSIAILAFILIMTGSFLPKMVFESDIFSSVAIASLIYTTGSALLVVIISWGISMLARNAGAIGVVCLALLCLTAENLMGNYIYLLHPLGVFDSAYGVILYNMKLIPLVSLIFTFAARDERNIKKDFAILIIGFFVVFAYFWGDNMGVIVAIQDPSKYNLPQYIRNMSDRISLSSQELVSSEYLEAAQRLFEDKATGVTSLYTLFPILLATGGAFIAALLTKVKKVAISGQSSLNMRQNSINQSGSANTASQQNKRRTQNSGSKADYQGQTSTAPVKVQQNNLSAADTIDDTQNTPNSTAPVKVQQNNLSDADTTDKTQDSATEPVQDNQDADTSAL